MLYILVMTFISVTPAKKYSIQTQTTLFTSEARCMTNGLYFHKKKMATGKYKSITAKCVKRKVVVGDGDMKEIL